MEEDEVELVDVEGVLIVVVEVAVVGVLMMVEVDAGVLLLELGALLAG